MQGVDKGCMTGSCNHTKDGRVCAKCAAIHSKAFRSSWRAGYKAGKQAALEETTHACKCPSCM